MCDISSQMMTVNQSSHVNIINPEERNIGRISNDVLGGLLGKYNPASCEIEDKELLYTCTCLSELVESPGLFGFNQDFPVQMI